MLWKFWKLKKRSQKCGRFQSTIVYEVNVSIISVLLSHIMLHVFNCIKVHIKQHDIGM